MSKKKKTPSRTVRDRVPRDRDRTASTFSPADVVAQRYRVLRFLARGGMGEVYEVEDLELRTRVALKTLLPSCAGNDERLRRFRREVLLARSVSHPGICRVYDLGRHQGPKEEVWFLTMELLEGESLATRMGRLGRIPQSQTLEWLRQMAAALDAAHRAGVLHRDFKPANVMLVPGPQGERVIVMDFGVARELAPEGTRGDAVTQSGVLVGTPAYLSPEQVMGQAAGSGADIYALGIVLYEMLTGTGPFTGPTPTARLTQRVLEDPVPPRSVVPEMDPRWEAAILGCLKRRPEERFESAGELLSFLEAPAGEGDATGTRVSSGLAVDGRAPTAILMEGRAGLRGVTGMPAVPYVLPAERDAFVGREEELAGLREKLSSGVRLLTVLGPAGSGKTRLVQHLGWTQRSEWPGGVWFCDLSEARTLEGIATVVAAVIGAPLGNKDDPMVRLGHAIAGRARCLVVLDNFEQIIAHAGATVGRWVERATQASFLVTSRERLQLRGEEVFALEPLPVEGAGVELFVLRARAQRSGFSLTESNAAAVREVVRLVDGLPLAIELAASRVQLLSPQQLVARMRERFTLLSGVRGARARHATLRAAIDWSWGLLAPWEQAALAQCSVFEGGFTLKASEAVLDLSPWPQAPWLIDVVQSLLDKSLLRTITPTGSQRLAIEEPYFGMYESIQTYAAEKLRTAGAMAEGASGPSAELSAFKRHGDYFAGYGSRDALEALDTHGGVARRRALEVELDNLIAACRRAVARGDGPVAVAALCAAWGVLGLRGPLQTAAELGGEVLALRALGPEHQHRAHRLMADIGLRMGHAEKALKYLEAASAIGRETGNRRDEGILLGRFGNHHSALGRRKEAREYYEAALAIHREVGNRQSEGVVLGNLGGMEMQQGRLREALHWIECAIQIHREVGNRRSEGIQIGSLALLQTRLGQAGEARKQYEEALAIHREVGNRHAEGTVLGNLGGLEIQQDRMEEARQHIEAALRIYREVGDRHAEGIFLGNLGTLAWDLGQADDARASFTAALAIHRETGNRPGEGTVLGNLGRLNFEQGRTEEARQHIEAALTIYREVDDRHAEGNVLGNLGLLEAKQGRFEQARLAFNNGEALMREARNPLLLGLLLCKRGECEHLAANRAGAGDALAEATLLAQQIGASPESQLGRAIAGLRQTLHA